MKSINKTTSRLPIAASLSLAVLLVGWGTATRLSAQSNDFDLDFSVAEIMDAVVMREADVIWQSVQFESTEDGFEMIGPETDEDWTELRHAAVALAESTNSLVIPGRHANLPGVEAAEGELAPADIDKLMMSQRGAWVGFAKALRAASLQTIEAIDARDLDKILDIGGTIDEACEACHLTFWYPNQ